MGLFERRGLIEDLRHNSTGNGCYAGYALLAAILVSYVPPREQASGILGGNAVFHLNGLTQKKVTAGCSNNDAITQMAF